MDNQIRWLLRKNPELLEELERAIAQPRQELTDIQQLILDILSEDDDQ